MSELLHVAWMFPALFALVFLGFPVAFSLFCVSLVFGYGIFGAALGPQLFGRILDASSNLVLGAIPLFVFMGSMLQRSGIAKRLFDVTRAWLGPLPGGLSVAAIVMCTIFAATSGVIGAVEIVVGLMAIPAMITARFDKGLISGTICAGGALGTIIPPSIVVVIYASIADMSVGDLFAGILIPGLVMVGLFLVYIVAWCWFRPEDGPPVSAAESRMPLSRKIQLTITALVPCALLIMAVLGSIFAGVASPTEAAALGAVGSVLLSAAYREFRFGIFVEALGQTVRITSMVVLIIAGGVLFSSIFVVGGGRDLVQQVIAAFNLGPIGMVWLFPGNRLRPRVRAGLDLDHPGDDPIFDPLVPRRGSIRCGSGAGVCHHPDLVPDAADGAVHLLSSQHRAQGLHLPGHVPGAWRRSWRCRW